MISMALFDEALGTTNAEPLSLAYVVDMARKAPAATIIREAST